MFKKILIPTDGSELSTQAGLRALPLAQLIGASVTVLYVLDPYPFEGVGALNPTSLQDYTAAARAEGSRAAGRIADAAKAAGVPIDTVVVENRQAADGIVEAAHGEACDLIVMGSHGRSGLARLMLGSVAAKVLALSNIPVLVIK